MKKIRAISVLLCSFHAMATTTSPPCSPTESHNQPPYMQLIKRKMAVGLDPKAAHRKSQKR